jgi:molybdate transport system substrate-binding protein
MALVDLKETSMIRGYYTRRLVCALALIAFVLGMSAPAVVAQTSAGFVPPVQVSGTNVTITVFAAASLTDAFREIGQKFELYNPGVKVVFNFAGSQILSQQLNQGAPADVFASANAAQMNTAVQGGRVSYSQVFVRNRLVVICPASNPGNISTLPDLARPGLQIVLAAQTVPVGQYAVDFLTKASADPTFSPSFKSDVLKNVVSYEDNVKAVLAKVALGEADAGIVYTTDVPGSDTAKVKRLYIPDTLNTVAAYPIAAVNDSPNLYWAWGFVRFVMSQDGQLVLWKYGFITNWIPTRPRR